MSLRLALAFLMLAALLGSAGCCRDRVLKKSAGPRIEEYPMPPAPPEARTK